MLFDNKVIPKTVDFCDVPNGEVFTHRGTCYLAIDDVEDGHGNDKNAIDLSNGEAVYFESYDQVIWVKATLTIENR